jgi:hypothetical protein
MDYSLGMHVVQGTKEFPHILSSIWLRKHLIFLLSNFIKEFPPSDVLHDQVDVFLIDVGLIVLHNIRVV